MIRLGALAYSPYVSPCALKNIVPHNRCKRPGVDAEIMAKIMHDMKLPYEVVEFSPYSKTGAFGEFHNGTYTGLFGEIQNGTIQVLVNDLMVDSLGREYFSYSYPMGHIEPTFVVRKPEINVLSTMLVPFKNFDTQLWGMLFGVILALLFCIVSVHFMFREKLKVWDYLQFVFNQTYNYLFEKTIPGKILLGTLGLLLVLIFNIYQSTLLTQLLIPQVPQPFKDANHLIELISQKQLTLLAKANWFYASIQHSEDPFYQRLRAALVNNPPVFEPDKYKRYEMLARGGYIYGVSDFKAHLYKEYSCNLMTVSGVGVPAYTRAFMFHRHWNLSSKFNLALLRNAYYAQNIWKKYSAPYEHCTEKPALGGTPLDMLALSGFFVLYFLNTFASLTAFFMEKWCASNSHVFPEAAVAEKSNWATIMFTVVEQEQMEMILFRFTADCRTKRLSVNQFGTVWF